MRHRLTTAMSLAAALIAGPAAAQFVPRYVCRQEARVGEGGVSAEYDQWMSPARVDVALAWTPRPSPPGTQFGLGEVTVVFDRPPTGESVARPRGVLVTYGVAAPKEIRWVAVRLGRSRVRGPVFLPAPYAFAGRPSAGYFRTLLLESRVLADDFAAGRPLEVYLMDGSGKVLASHIEPLGDRAAALEALNRIWPEVERKGAQATTLCQPWVLEE